MNKLKAPRLLGGRYVFRSLGVESVQESFLQQQGAFNFRSLFHLSASSIANGLMGHCKFQFSSRVSTCGQYPSQGFRLCWQFLVHDKVLVGFVWLSRLQSKWYGARHSGFIIHFVLSLQGVCLLLAFRLVFVFFFFI